MSAAAAAKALLEAALPDNVKVYEGKVIGDPPTLYVIVTALPAKRVSTTYARGTDSRETGVRLTICAVVPIGATGSPTGMLDNLVGWCEAALDRVRPEPGWSAFHHDTTVPMPVSEDVKGRVTAYAVADFLITTP